MKEVTIWHNEKCSKSRAALALLIERGYDPRIFSYLEHAPSEPELRRILLCLGMKSRELIRTKEAIYRELGLADQQDDDVLIRAMVEHPILIERPIVECGDRAVIGRPPQEISSVLDDESA